MKPRVREVIVVEGRYDRNTLLQAVDAAVIETGGFAVFNDREKTAYLRRLAQTRGLILLTDPDGAGFVIRNRLKGAIPTGRVLHAYVPDVYGKEKRKAHPSKEGKLGVEGVPEEVLLRALTEAGIGVDTVEQPSDPITKMDLFELGLSGREDSAQRRKQLSARLKLPEHLTTNALVTVLGALMSREELYDLMDDSRQEEQPSQAGI